MSLKILPAPKRIQTALLQALPSLYRFLQENPPVGVHHDELTNPNIKLWLPVYVAHAPAFSRSRRPRKVATQPGLKVRRVGWRCFLKTKQGVNIAIELDVKDSVHIHHQFQQGESIQRTFKRLRAAARSERLRRKRYIARLLFVPSLYFSALWFSGNGSRDLFVSLVSLGSELKTGRFYSRPEIVHALGIEMSRRKAAHQLVLTRKSLVLRRRSDRRE